MLQCPPHLVSCWGPQALVGPLSLALEWRRDGLVLAVLFRVSLPLTQGRWDGPGCHNGVLCRGINTCTLYGIIYVCLWLSLHDFVSLPLFTSLHLSTIIAIHMYGSMIPGPIPDQPSTNPVTCIVSPLKWSTHQWNHSYYPSSMKIHPDKISTSIQF